MHNTNSKIYILVFTTLVSTFSLSYSMETPTSSPSPKSEKFELSSAQMVLIKRAHGSPKCARELFETIRESKSADELRIALRESSEDKAILHRTLSCIFDSLSAQNRSKVAPVLSELCEGKALK
jgi:hypothetical protein